jgi:hypothetical protein
VGERRGEGRCGEKQEQEHGCLRGSGGTVGMVGE